MGLTKRIFVERDPAYADVRRQYAHETTRYLKQFPFRIGTRRRNRMAAKPYWDSTWRVSLQRAGKELGIEVAWVNDSVFLRTEAEMALLQGRAETLCEEFHARLKGRARP
jgi:hypothetical protein